MTALDTNARAPLQLVGGGTLAVLEQFRGSPLLAAGKLTIVALDAIAERLGSRWTVRRELVYEHAERVLRRGLGSQAVVQRISETEYIVAQSERPRMAGQLQCLNCLRELLHHFLGEAPVGDLSVHEVTRIADDGIYGQRLDAGRVEQAEAAERLSTAPEPEQPSTLDRWTPFATSTGVRVGVTCALEPVVYLKNSGRIGYRVASRVQHHPGFAALTRSEFERLAPPDIEKIDFATIARGLDRVRSTQGKNKPPTLILPVSHVTLQSRRGRATIVELLRKAREHVVHGLICELTDLEGVPQAALLDLIAALRPFCLHVVGRIADARNGDARHLMGASIGGLSTRCPSFEGDAEFLGWLKSFVRMNRQVSRTLLIYQLREIKHARLAAHVGITHYSLAPTRLKVHLIDDEPR